MKVNRMVQNEIPKRKIFGMAEIILVTIIFIVAVTGLAWAQAPANDNFADAALLEGEFCQITVSNVNATSEPDEPEHADEYPWRSVWWKWTPPQTSYFTFDTKESSFDTILVIYTGSSFDTLTEVVANNDEIEDDDYSSVTFQAMAETQYYILVDGYDNASGNIILNWKFADRPENDDFASALVMEGLKGNIAGSNMEATKEASEPDHAGRTYCKKSVWWKWTAPETNYFFFESFGTFDTLLSVYTGSDVSHLTEVANSGYWEESLTVLAQAGVQYHIAVDMGDSYCGDYYLCWTIADRPENDDFASAPLLSGDSGQATGSNKQAMKEAGEPDHGDNKGGKSVWWKWTAPRSDFFLFNTLESFFDTTLAVYTGSDINNLTEITSNNNGRKNGRNTLQSVVTFQAETGAEYYIAVDGAYGETGQIDLRWESVMPLPSDDIEDAFGLTGLNGQAYGSNIRATQEESDEPDHAGKEGGKSVWWSWYAPQAGSFSFDTHGSSFDTLLAIYTIPPDKDIDVDYLTEIAASDNDGNPDNTSSLTFQAQAGLRYYIATDGYNGDSGDILLNWRTGPPNGVFANASELTGASGQACGSNLNATTEIGETVITENAGGKSVWWTWVAPKDDNFAFNTHGSSFDTLLAVYTGSGINDLTKIASNDDEGSENTSSVTFGAQAGIRYYIAVDGKDRQEGNIILNWKFSAASHIYKFERMWPGLQQPWYLNPVGVATDSNGFIYVADFDSYRVQKFTSDGRFVAKWGGRGYGDGEFSGLQGLTVDNNGFVYVADTYNHRIQKFTSDGRFVAKWGRIGSEDGQFQGPTGIITDDDGFVYVVDSGNDRIQKFTSDGQFQTKWITCDSGEERFSNPHGIARDGMGIIYVVLDSSEPSIRKFTSDGELIGKWGTYGKGEGELWGPRDIATDTEGYVYVADTRNNRVQKFTSEGDFVAELKTYSDGDRYYDGPYGVTTDASGFVYVADYSNLCIHKFSSDNQFVSKWGSRGNEDGEFYGPVDIATDNEGYIYVDDTGNNRIQKFSPDGQFIAKWEQETGDYSIFDNSDTALDSNGFFYVLDSANDSVEKFDPEGHLVKRWGSEGSGDGQFDGLGSIAVDSNDFIYVTDKGNSRIQKFTSDGVFITAFGEFGSNPGQLAYPRGLAISSDGKVYVSDTGNNRVQVFKPTLTKDKTKAIVLAGGGPYENASGGRLKENTLWEATQLSANFAYRALTYQGFTKDSIFYLSSDTQLDLDGNGEADDVDRDATNANLEYAITEWAKDADSLVIYITDHGGDNVFRMSRTETLSSGELDSWLDTLQQTMPGKVIVVYDACESGSFVTMLTPPADKERIVVASTSPDEPAYFVTQGSVSFSGYFWTHVFNGFDVRDAFDFSKQAMESPTEFQHPLLDADSDGMGNSSEDYQLAQNVYIGNGTDMPGLGPDIETVSCVPAEETTFFRMTASGVTDEDGVVCVWAVIRPPDYNPGASSSAVQSLPSVDLIPLQDQAGIYEKVYDGFNIRGTYQIAVYAKDRNGNTSVYGEPLSVTVENPLTRRAIIVAGGPDPWDNPLWPAIEKNAALAYEALKFQGYGDEGDRDDIYLISPANIPGQTDSHVPPSVDNLRHAIETWAAQNLGDLVLYMTGNAESGAFRLSSTENLLSADLDQYLDHLQNSTSAKVTVIYDACGSGAFLSSLTTPEAKDRILISSATGDQCPNFVSEGSISFSQYFWNNVIDGMNIRDAFKWASEAVRNLGQIPTLDANSDGLSDGISDKRIAQKFSIGAGIMLAGDDPIIGAVSVSPGILNGETSVTIQAENVTATGAVGKVLALVMPPDTSLTEALTNLPIVELTDMGNGVYKGIYSDFSQVGIYRIIIYAADEAGNLSQPLASQIEQKVQTETSSEPDILEISLARDASANLTVYDSENRACGKNSCDIPGAAYETGASGEQIISLTELTEGNWRAVLHGTQTGPCDLTVSSFHGTTEFFSETRTAEIKAHQVLRLDISVSSELTFTVSEPKIPEGPDGNPLWYDFDGDGDTDDDDINRVSSIWNTQAGDAEFDAFYDLDDDGTITILDIMPVANSKSVR
ncbi:C13 family peptidase [Desulfonema magnum]|uniref:NHL repeat-containing protein n=1 Tax=Desulfonema magnum TaxID=45655 RepID=A0A975GPP6_9BACT|nr:C13 family peptidase [Desulfonema magnum]QTA88123.1 NHL repeat-containing protein [Desulfonema magnum]